MTAPEVIDLFESSCEIIRKATLAGDYRANNREHDRLTEVFKQFEIDSTLAAECLPKMLCSENIVLRIQSAAYCLALEENVDQAIAVLEKAAKEDSTGIFGFNAEMTLSVWKKDGQLKIY